jgi:hypothetical protein
MSFLTSYPINIPWRLHALSNFNVILLSHLRNSHTRYISVEVQKKNGHQYHNFHSNFHRIRKIISKPTSHILCITTRNLLNREHNKFGLHFAWIMWRPFQYREYTASNVGWRLLLNWKDLEGRCRDIIEVLFCHFPGGAEEQHEYS